MPAQSVSLQTSGHMRPVLYVDFNNVAAGGLQKARSRPWALEVGQEVRLCDHEGNSCLGMVRRVGVIARVAVREETWIDEAA